MISEQLKKRVELKFGKLIRYPKDCRGLSIELEKVCLRKVSAATLMRIFGIIKEPCNPTLHTLDLLAEYAGFECHREVVSSDYLPIRRKAHSYLKLTDIIIGSTFVISTLESKLVLTKVSDNTFQVLGSENTNLEIGDTLMILRIDLGYPIICECITRSGRELGSYCFDWQNKVVAITQ